MLALEEDEEDDEEEAPPERYDADEEEDEEEEEELDAYGDGVAWSERWDCELFCCCSCRSCWAVQVECSASQPIYRLNGRSFGRSVVRSFVRSFGRSVVRAVMFLALAHR